MRIKRRLCWIAGLAIAVAGCARTPPNRAHGATYTAGTEQELQAGVNRLQQLKHDLLQERFRVVSQATSEAADTFDLAGNFGSLKNLTVTLRIGKQLESKDPQLATGLSAFVQDSKAEQDFHELDDRLTVVLLGKPGKH